MNSIHMTDRDLLAAISAALELLRDLQLKPETRVNEIFIHLGQAKNELIYREMLL